MKKRIKILLLIALLLTSICCISINVFEREKVKKQSIIYANNCYVETFVINKMKYNFLEKKYELMLISEDKVKSCNIIIYSNRKNSKGKFIIDEI